ncbi:MAG: chorismate synthase [Bacillota bacterium]
MFEYFTAGESHGPKLTAIIKSLPANLEININKLNAQLARRQQGYGRGKRMEIERDKAEISSGLRHGTTLGSPLTLEITNKDWVNWRETMAIYKNKVPQKLDSRKITTPRPGHADLAGALKYNFRDMRNILERASARETAARTGVGAICRQFLDSFSIKIYSHVIQIGDIKSPSWTELKKTMNLDSPEIINEFFTKLDSTPLRCHSETITEDMIKLLDREKANGDSVGGICEIICTGLPVGLGSHLHPDTKLDGRLAGALMSIQAVKGVEIGAGFKAASLPGSQVHDQIYYENNQFYRKTNQAGGIEGGISTGSEIILRIGVKPIPTLSKPLQTVDIDSKKSTTAAKERADNCAVPAAGVVAEAVSSIILAQAFTAKFGGDSMKEITRNYEGYIKQIQDF